MALSTLTLTDFLLARIAEDELLAGTAPVVRFSDNPRVESHSPARILAECEAKRRIVAVHEWRNGHCVGCDPFRAVGPEPCLTLPHLAAVYSDHPDFREEWRP